LIFFSGNLPEIHRKKVGCIQKFLKITSEIEHMMVGAAVSM
jgi:hypothetical protein